jgi:hypothetical protein
MLYMCPCSRYREPEADISATSIGRCRSVRNVVDLLLLPIYFYYFYCSPPLSAGSFASVLSPFAHSIVSRYRTAAARAPPSPSRRRLRSQHPIHHCASLDVLTNLRYARTAHSALDHRPARPCGIGLSTLGNSDTRCHIRQYVTSSAVP